MNAEEVIEQIRVIVFDEDTVSALRVVAACVNDRTAEEGYLYDALNDIQNILLGLV